MNDEEVVEHEKEGSTDEPVEETPKSRRPARKRSSSTGTPARPAPATQGALRVRVLNLRNRSGTLLFLPVLNGDGTKKSLRMGANATVKVPEDQLTDHARRLLHQGLISIDPHR
jgi:hypothetical protein